MEGETFDLEAEQNAQARAVEAAGLKTLTEDTDLEWLMSLQQGRRIVWRLLSLAGVYQLSFAGEETHVTAFAEGGRNLGLKWLSEVHRLCPDLYGVMVKENAK